MVASTKRKAVFPVQLASRIAGMHIKEGVPQSGLICLHYPYLASMQPKTTGQGAETQMHTSGTI
jgi:hypothetical protein